MLSVPWDLLVKNRTAVGGLSIHKEISEPIVEAIWRAGSAPDRRGRAGVLFRGIGIAQIVQALVVPMGRGPVTPARHNTAMRDVRPSRDALRRHLLVSGRVGQGVDSLANPVSGGDVPVNRVQKLFITARQAGLSSPGDLSDFFWRALSGKVHKMLTDGKFLENEHANRAELAAHAREFLGLAQWCRKIQSSQCGD